MSDGRAARAVVAGEENEGIFLESLSLQLLDERADEFVHIGHHVSEAALLVRSGRRLLLAVVRRVGRRLIGPVHENHRVIEEERLVARAADEIERELLARVGTIVPRQVTLGRFGASVARSAASGISNKSAALRIFIGGMGQ